MSLRWARLARLAQAGLSNRPLRATLVTVTPNRARRCRPGPHFSSFASPSRPAVQRSDRQQRFQYEIVTNELLASPIDQWRSILQRHGSAVDQILKEWNGRLKHVRDAGQLQQQVSMVDKLVRGLLATKVDPASDIFAVYVGMSAWARIANDTAAYKAEELFELLDFELDVAYDLQVSMVRDRRNLYHALLLAWSRSMHPAAPERAMAWFRRMQGEEKEHQLQKWRLVNIHCYNRVMAACAGQLELVEQLWAELRPRRLRPNAVTYDCLIKAIQQTADADRACRIFAEQLQAYQKLTRPSVSDRPLALTLGRVLTMLRDKPDQGRLVLHQALDLESEHLECRGLVDARAFALVMHAHTTADNVEGAEQLMTLMIDRYEAGNDHLRPTRKIFGLVMDGYAQRNHVPLDHVETILQSMEKHLLRNGERAADMDCGAYNILMTAYLRRWPPDVVEKIEATIERMIEHAKHHELPALMPDAVSYTILMQAMLKEGRPGFQHSIEEVLFRMKEGVRDRKNQRMLSYTVALDAWAKSDDPNCLEHAEMIFGLAPEPDTTCCNIMMHIYAKRGLVDRAFSLLERMKQDYTSGRNRFCRPDNITYSSLILALRVSRGDGRWEKASVIFDEMLERFLCGDSNCRPTVATVVSLLKLLAACEVPTTKHLIARDVLHKIGTLGLRQGPTTACAFIAACRATTGDERDLREAFSFVLGGLESLGGRATPEVYSGVLEACHDLIVEPEERNTFYQEVFQACAEAGQVDRTVLQSLRNHCPPDLYHLLTSQDSAKEADDRAIPREWARNVK